MDFTSDEEKLLRPYLEMDAGAGGGWGVVLAAGLVVCAAAVLIAALGVWADAAPYCPLIFVAGLVIVEQALNRRDRARMARILQKYDAALRRLMYPEEEEETL